jgi:protein subunit release factor A
MIIRSPFRVDANVRCVLDPNMNAPYRLDRASLAAEVRVDTFRAAGHGGQNLHKTESAVRLTHLPSGIVVVASDTRSQNRNREIAFDRLIERLKRLNHRPKPRKATRVPKSQREKRLLTKKVRATTKRMRGRVRHDSE